MELLNNWFLDIFFECLIIKNPDSLRLEAVLMIL